jgi:hypothetical protein
MTSRRRAHVAAALLGGVACGAAAVAACGGGGNKPPDLGVTDSGHGADVVGHDAPPTGSESGSDGPGMDAGKDASKDAAEGGGPEDVSTEVIDLGPDGGALCDLTTIWGAPTPVLTTAAADSTIFGAVTPDELTLAWTSRTGTVVTAWYADRASTATAFGAPQAVGTSLAALAMDRVTLSGDGLRIGGVAADGHSLIGAKRASRSAAFTTADTEFASLGGAEAAATLATPLLAGDDSELVYLQTSGSSDYVVHESSGGLPTWKGGPALTVSQLARTGTMLRRPSGLSLDRLTLFYWDETTGSEKESTRPTLTQPFNLFLDLGGRVNAAPTASCQRIYYALPVTTDAAGAGAITIVYADGALPDQ